MAFLNPMGGGPSVDLECLNVWPDGTCGYNTDEVLIAKLVELCSRHGFGRVPQLAAQIEDLWRHPERVAEYLKMREQQLRVLARAKELRNG